MTNTSPDAQAPVRVGIIGAGFGAQAMAPTFDGTDGCEVAEVVSARDQDAVARLCARTDLDVVCVHSPPFLHLDHVSAAAEAGHHILCDKPFGQDLAAARALHEFARDTDALRLTNFELRFEPWRIAVDGLIASGTLGRVESIHWLETNDAWRNSPGGWQLDKARGGGWLGAAASHTLDTMTRWAGALRPTAVELVTPPGLPDAAEIACTLALASDTGARCTISTSGAEPRTSGRRVVVNGSQATVELRSDGSLVLEGAAWPSSLPAWEPVTGSFGMALSTWAGHVRDAVLDHRDGGARLAVTAPTFDDGLACAELLDAVRALGAAQPAIAPPASTIRD